ALHKGIIPFGATFFVFSDYLRPSIRLASLMGLPVKYVFTHDSIAVGEDGPTHQPVEHLASLRAIPGLVIIRPADATETAEAWRQALMINHAPVALILSRQKLPVLDQNEYGSAQGLAKGAYILADSEGAPDLLIIATGSEVHIALAAGKELASKGISARVVSMPSQELFKETSKEYQNSILPAEVTARIAVEAGSPMGWESYIGERGKVVGISKFGASAPGGTLMEQYGITAENIIQKAMDLLGR
ncbi:MAG: transketolase, partial [Deltaproteobacteria bacterium]|nr:transketolase [Deltaproteobacteria bacterium]